MAASEIELLLKLRGDPSGALAAVKRLRTQSESDFKALRQVISQRINLNIAPPGKQADAHVKEFRKIEAEATKSTKGQEREQTRLNRAVESLQRQRSAALIRLFRQEEREAERSARAIQRAQQRAIASIQRSLSNLGSNISRLGRNLSIGLTAPIVALGYASVRSARDIDAQANTLRAFTGSAQAAEVRLRELIATAQKTPGLTTSLGLLLDAQLRTASVTVETIDKVLPAIGRLNAVSRLQDPSRFAQNLVQLVTQNFERIDLKELVGQSPIAGEVIKELFNVDSPINAEAIRESAKKMGLTTTEAFFTAFAAAAARNQALANVTESIGTRLEKLGDRIGIALRPLGLAILDAVTPAIERLVPLLERMSLAFASLSQPVQFAVIAIAGIVAAIGPALFILGPIVSAIITIVGAIGTLTTAVGGFIPLATIIGAVLLGIVGALAQLGPAVAIAALWIETLRRAWNENVGDIRDRVIVAFGEIRDFLSRLGVELVVIYERIGPEIEATVQFFLNNMRRFWEDHGETIVRVAREAWAIVGPIVTTALRLIGDAIVFFLRILRHDWAGAWDSVKDAVSRVIPVILTTFARFNILVVQILAQIVAGLTRWAIDLAKAAYDAAVKMVDSFVNYLETEGVRRAVAAALAIAAALSDPGVLAAYAYSGLRAAQARNDAYNAAVARAETRPGSRRPEDQVGADTSPTIFRKRAPGAPGGAGGGGKGKGANEETRRRQREIALDLADFEADFRRTTERIERDYESRLINLENFTRQQIQTLEQNLEDQKSIFSREEAEAQRAIKNAKDLDLALREIEQKRTKAVDEFNKRKNELEKRLADERDAAALARLEALAKAEDAADQGRISRLEASADRGRTSEERAAREIGKIRLAAHDRDLRLLRERLAREHEGSADHVRIQGEITAAEQERQNASEEIDREIEAGRQKDLEGARKHRDQLADIYGSIAETVFQARERAIRLARERALRAIAGQGGNVAEKQRDAEIKAIREETELATAREVLRHAQISTEIQDQIDALERKKELNDRERELLKAYHAELEAERRRHNSEVEAIRQDGEDAERHGQTRGTLLLEDTLNKLKATLSFMEFFKLEFVRIITELEDAFKQGIVAALLYGEGLDQALKKALAAILANIAAEALIQALKHAAYALASLAFFNFAGAAAHAKAAAAFGALAVAAGAGASALSKSAQPAGAGANTGPVAGGLFSENTERDRTIREQRRGGAPNPNQINERVVEKITIIEKQQIVEPPQGWVMREVKTGYRRNQEGVRDLVRYDLLKQPSG